MKILLLLAFLELTPQDDSVDSILRDFQETRPGKEDLSLYLLDWVPSLEEARRRAAQEKRPILLVLIRNDFGNFFTGHC